MQEEHISDHKDSRDSRDSRKEEIFTQEQFFALKKEKKENPESCPVIRIR